MLTLVLIARIIMLHQRQLFRCKEAHKWKSVGRLRHNNPSRLHFSVKTRLLTLRIQNGSDSRVTMAKRKKREESAADSEVVPKVEPKPEEFDPNQAPDDIGGPPPTPSSQLGLEFKFEPLPCKLPGANDLKIPIVRATGVKLCIDALSEYFGCGEYKFNLFQFWFLDVVTDCLWRVQDEFRFPEELQRTVLGWILFIFDLMRGGSKRLSRC